MYGAIGHDLKEPIAFIHSLSCLALEGELDREQQKEVISKIKTLSLNANLLAKNLLEWAYMNRNDLKPMIQKTNITKVISSETRLYQTIADERNIRIMTQFNHDKDLKTDEDMFSLIIRNLLNNAVKYSYDNQTVSIQTYTKDEQLNITIQDHGQGMNEAQIKTLNSADHSFSKTRRSLGLELTKAYIKLLYAQISIEGEEKKGTTIHLSFPDYD
jgi:signal transduction histidine kinase